MVKSCIFDNAGMLKRHPDIPHYGEDVVCFESVYGDRNYPEGEAYFNRELYLIILSEYSICTRRDRRFFLRIADIAHRNARNLHRNIHCGFVYELQFASGILNVCMYIVRAFIKLMI